MEKNMKKIEISEKFSNIELNANEGSYQKGCIDLTEGNPTKFLFSKNQKIKLNLNELYSYSVNSHGQKKVRQKIKEYYQIKNRMIHIDDLFLTTGTSESISYIFKVFCNPNDTVLIPSPGYPIFEYLSDFENLNFKYYKLIYNKEGEWKIDFEYLNSLLNENVKILILVNPNNPTGSVLKNTQLNELEKFLLKNNILLIIDEVFIDYNHVPLDKFIFNFNIPSIYLNGISKSFGLPGLKIGWILMNGSKEFKDNIRPYFELICDTYLSVSNPSQLIVKNIFKNEIKRQKKIKNIIIRNYKEIKKIVRSNNFLIPLNIDFGWYLPLRVVTSISIDTFTEYLLKDVNVKVYSGKLFHFQEDKIIVISLLSNKKNIQKGFKRINKFISSF
jgi:alanine-synthesizing transaminase